LERSVVADAIEQLLHCRHDLVQTARLLFESAFREQFLNLVAKVV